MGLLDRLLFPRPTEPTAAPPSAPPPAPDERVGSGGTSTYGGYVENREASAALRGSQRHKTLADMVLNIAIVATAVRRVYRLVGAVSWTMAPARGDGIDEEAAKDAADFAAHAIFDATKDTTPVGKWAKRIASAEFFGASVQEWTARAADDARFPGRVVFDRIDWRPTHTIDRWDADANGKIHGVWQRLIDTGSLVYLPRAKLVYHVDDELSDNPEGTGLLRHAAETVRRLGAYLAIEGKGYQNSVNGNMVGRAPVAAMRADKLTEAQITEAKSGLKDYLENHRKKEDLHIVLDSRTYKNPDGSPSNVPMWGIDVLEAGNDLDELGKAIQRDLWLAAVVLHMEHVMLGSSGGSLAMQAQKSADFYRFVEGLLETIAAVISRDLIGPLWIMNGIDPSLKPTPKFGRLAMRDIGEVIAAIAQLSSAGVTLDRSDDAVKAIMDFLGLPALEELDQADALDARDRAAAAAGMERTPIDPLVTEEQ